MNPIELAQKLRRARLEGKAVAALTSELPNFSWEAAYQVQAAGLSLDLAGGEKLSGYKMGLTSLAKQRDVKVYEPIRGYLLASMEVENGASVATEGRIHPRFEPEVAVVMKRMPVSLRDLGDAIEGVYPALEILDSRFEGFQFQLPDVVADNTSASGYLIGRHRLPFDPEELRLVGVVVRKNGRIEHTGAPAAVLGDPFRSVWALVRALMAQGKQLENGHVILSGGITASLAFKAGDVLEVEWPGETLMFRGV
jgi:2-oxo-3-hexenedioate decarboxylase